MITLGARAQGRDNNFNLIRMVAAAAVLASHAYPIALGQGAEQPLEALLGMSLGSVAVLVFFAISGFLIMASYDRSRNLIEFGVARGLRIYPGLLVALLATVFVLGPLVTRLPLSEYLRDRSVYTYLAQGLALYRIQFALPGVFEDNLFPKAVNGSLWTLFYEAACYALVAAAGGLLLRRGPAPILAALVALFAAMTVVALHADAVPYKIAMLARLGLPFVAGAALYLVRDRTPLSLPAAVVFLIGACWLAGTAAFLSVFSVALTYFILCLAYGVRGSVLQYNKIGDYSYGMYIYAFPVQQTVAFILNEHSPLVNMSISLPLTLVLAVLSWHLIEKPALETKKAILQQADRLGVARLSGR